MQLERGMPQSGHSNLLGRLTPALPFYMNLDDVYVVARPDSIECILGKVTEEFADLGLEINEANTLDPLSCIRR